MNGISSLGTPPCVPLPAALHAASNGHASPAAVGKQFESIFASMIIKQMRLTADGESLFGKDPGDVVGGLFDHYLGEHIAGAGGLGIAQMVQKQLERRGHRT